MEFKDILKLERVKNSIKQSALGERIGLSVQTISAYEKGLREPKLDILVKLADLLASLIVVAFSIANTAAFAEKTIARISIKQILFLIYFIIFIPPTGFASGFSHKQRGKSNLVLPLMSFTF